MMVMADWGKPGTAASTSVSYYLVCVTLDGLPLFSLVEGELPTLSFPVIGSLNAVHMFAKGNQVDLGVTTTEDGTKIFWKEFGSIKLIFVNFENTPDAFLSVQLDCVYKCMVMVLGAHEFSKVSNVEKLKKKLKLCFPLITHFLNSSYLLSNITHLTDVLLIDDTGLLQNYLNSFAEECQSEFAFLTLHRKVAVGTEKFWHLAPIETSLVLHLLSSLATMPTSVDIPIYLPHGSPTVPHRLVSVNLLENVQVVLICGPKPPLQTILHKYVKKYWGPVLQTLSSYTRLQPRGFPPELKLESNLLGFILLNTTERKTLSCVHPQGSLTGSNQIYLSTAEKREHVLMGFYRYVSHTYFNCNSKDKNENTAVIRPKVRETYKCTDKYKCYALQSKHHEMYALYDCGVPTYSLGTITRQVVKVLTKDKAV